VALMDLTIGQVIIRTALFCIAALLVTGLLWLGTQVAIRRGWIVRRSEPIREWVELGEATRDVGRAIRASLPSRLRRWL
jgi:hypothetical protein